MPSSDRSWRATRSFFFLPGLPGFGVPRYVREVAGVAHKVEL